MDIETTLTRGVTNIIPEEKELAKLLSSDKKLNVYLGIDPTATKIHIGHAVALRKLQEFVELGHNVTFLIGDFTALIGDTSDKKSEKPILTSKEIEENFKSYKKQAKKILDFSKVTLRQNSEWLKKLTFTNIVELAQNFSVGDFVGRELIRKRLDEGTRERLDEMLYPVMQGYDSCHLHTDIQIGGADQTFNMQAGRTLQKNLRNKESFVLVTGYIEGTDGRKMSKSWGNAIWLEDSPNDMFGKVMSIRDELILNYFNLATNIPSKEVAEIEKELKEAENPIVLKTKLAETLVSELHSKEEAKKAKEHFEKTFQEGEPEFKKEIENKGNLVSTIAQEAGSNSEAKRLIAHEAVDVDGETITDPTFKLKGGEKVQIGKKIFVKIRK